MNPETPAHLGFARVFEDLWIWQQARWMVRDVYRDLGVGTPAERDFGFRGQIQDAAVSAMNNIAEGFERKSSNEFHRFLDIAKGSCGEVRSMYYTAEDLHYVSPKVANERRTRCAQVSAGIASLMATLDCPRQSGNVRPPSRHRNSRSP
jgi:four helix bundle protein